MKQTILTGILFLMFACIMQPPVVAAAATAKPATVRVQLHDLPLLDQNGKQLLFKSDVIGDKLVAITFTYTTCTTICPILDSIFVKLQDKLPGRLGKDVFLVTVSIDPVNDIPPRLKAYAGKLKAKPGWSFLTGNKVNVDKVLTGLDMFSADILNHTPSMLVGDGKSGVWRRFYGFPSSDKLLAALNELSAARSR
ncbi:MAG: SCO family protein [Geobacter sp.]|nr:SCO family protein [Geobacter sp.]